VPQGDIYLVSPEGRFLESYTLEADPKLIAQDWAKVRESIEGKAAKRNIHEHLFCVVAFAYVVGY